MYYLDSAITSPDARNQKSDFERQIAMLDGDRLEIHLPNTNITIYYKFSRNVTTGATELQLYTANFGTSRITHKTIRSTQTFLFTVGQMPRCPIVIDLENETISFNGFEN